MQHTTAEIMGGLGNQLFQIFALLAYALHYKVPFYFSPAPIQHGQRKQTYWHTPLLRALYSFVKTPPTTPSITLREQGFHFQPIPFYEQVHIKLFGYFQSYKYFQAQEATICRLLRLKETQAAVKEKTHYNYEKTLAVHFRVGDYVQLPNHHPLMTMEYYTKALTQFLQDIRSSKQISPALCETLEQAQQAEQTQQMWHILYFCEQNDQAYVETQFIQKLQHEFQGQFTFQCIDHQFPDWEQMIVMSLCKHHIIANSTFSWWGAYLGGTPPTTPASLQPNASAPCDESLLGGVRALPHKEDLRGLGGVGACPQVYYPTTWFGPAMGYKNMADLFPPHWQKINV